MRKLLILSTLVFLAAFTTHRPTAVGETVFAWWEPNQIYFVGTVVEDHGANALVVFEDGDNAVVARAKMRPMEIRVGSKVLARWSDEKYYPGRVDRIVGRALHIAYDDGDEGWTSWAGIAAR
jgi:uncharacterized OB-fold protein